MKDIVVRSITALILSASFFTVFFLLPPIVFSIMLAGILLCILLCEWPNFFSPTNPRFWVIMPLYPVLPFLLLIALNENSLARELMLMLFVIVACADMGGYVFGSLFGKHKIAPRISPGKTWEGFAGGICMALIGACILLFLQHKQIQLLPVAGITIILCALSTMGDLFESWLKRNAGIKNSGSLLPGHGGFLDRFDGILFGVMVVYVFRDYLIQIF